MLVYGSENWALNRSEGRVPGTAEMRFLRRVSGYQFTDHARNTTIHNALQIHASEERIRDYNNKWHNHISEMYSSRLDSRNQNNQPDVGRNVRPRERGEDSLQHGTR
jgi:hypothetical protein